MCLIGVGPDPRWQVEIEVLSSELKSGDFGRRQQTSAQRQDTIDLSRGAGHVSLRPSFRPSRGGFNGNHRFTLSGQLAPRPALSPLVSRCLE